MRLGRLVLGWVVALALLAGVCVAQAQTDPHFVDSLAGKLVSQDQPEWESLHQLVIQSFPDSKPFTVKKGAYYVWRIRSEDLVFQATDPASTDGQSYAGFYWFDLQSKPISGAAFSTGSRSYYKSCDLVDVSGVSAYTVKVVLEAPLSRPIEEDFGLDGYRPVLLRYAKYDGTLAQNQYSVPNYACGPHAPAYSRADLLLTLSGANPLLQLEALTWLAASHSFLTADIITVPHEPVAESVRFWSLSNDSAVSQAASALEGSSVEWISQAAKFYVAVSKPQPVPGVTLEPRLKELAIQDIRLGHGGDFDEKDRPVKIGDRVVFEYEVKLPNGTVAFTNLNTNANPSIFQIGSHQVIAGMSQGLIGMKVGGLRIIDIPAALAYGDAGADVVPPGADLTYRVRLLHIATEPPFGEAAEKVIKIKDVLIGQGKPVPIGATANVTCKVYRLDGHELNVPDFTGIKEMVLFTGSPLKKALLGMRVGGQRRLLVNFPNIFDQNQGWFHYSAQVLEVQLNSFVVKP